MRRRFSYANVAATLALVFSMSGGALAAKHYLINSTKQINPKVLKAITNDTKPDTTLFTTLAATATVAKAGSAATAGSASTAGHASSADSATTAGTANNANQLQGLTANELVRGTTAAAGNKADPCGGGEALKGFESTTFTNVVSNTVNAPTSGILMVWGHTSSEFDASSPAKSFLRLLGRLAVDGTQAGPESENSLTDIEENCKEGRTMSLDTAVQVSAGPHTVAFQVAKSAFTGGEGKAFVGNGSVTTLFVPFGNSGTQGSLAARFVPGAAGSGNH